MSLLSRNWQREHRILLGSYCNLFATSSHIIVINLGIGKFKLEMIPLNKHECESRCHMYMLYSVHYESSYIATVEQVLWSEKCTNRCNRLRLHILKQVVLEEYFLWAIRMHSIIIDISRHSDNSLKVKSSQISHNMSYPTLICGVFIVACWPKWKPTSDRTVCHILSYINNSKNDVRQYRDNVNWEWGTAYVTLSFVYYMFYAFQK
jgi:hypothetical protein